MTIAIIGANRIDAQNVRCASLRVALPQCGGLSLPDVRTSVAGPMHPDTCVLTLNALVEKGHHGGKTDT